MKLKRFLKSTALLLLVAVFSVGVIACGNDDDDRRTPSTVTFNNVVTTDLFSDANSRTLDVTGAYTSFAQNLAAWPSFVAPVQEALDRAATRFITDANLTAVGVVAIASIPAVAGDDDVASDPGTAAGAALTAAQARTAVRNVVRAIHAQGNPDNLPYLDADGYPTSDATYSDNANPNFRPDPTVLPLANVQTRIGQLIAEIDLLDGMTAPEFPDVDDFDFEEESDRDAFLAEVNQYLLDRYSYDNNADVIAGYVAELRAYLALERDFVNNSTRYMQAQAVIAMSADAFSVAQTALATELSDAQDAFNLTWEVRTYVDPAGGAPIPAVDNFDFRAIDAANAENVADAFARFDFDFTNATVTRNDLVVATEGGTAFQAWYTTAIAAVGAIATRLEGNILAGLATFEWNADDDRIEFELEYRPITNTVEARGTLVVTGTESAVFTAQRLEYLVDADGDATGATRLVDVRKTLEVTTSTGVLTDMTSAGVSVRVNYTLYTIVERIYIGDTLIDYEITTQRVLHDATTAGVDTRNPLTNFFVDVTNRLV
jgi:hypothetical protein